MLKQSPFDSLDVFGGFLQKHFKQYDWMQEPTYEKIENFVRVSFRTKSYNPQELIVDLMPGPQTAFGYSITQRLEKGWGYVFGPEIIEKETGGLSLSTPLETFYNYLYGALNPRGDIRIGPQRDMDIFRQRRYAAPEELLPEERFNYLRSYGFMSEGYSVAGGLELIQPDIYGPTKRRMLAETVSVRMRPKTSFEDIANAIARQSYTYEKEYHAGARLTENEMAWRQLMGFGVLPSGTAELMRLGRIGNVFWDEEKQVLLTELISSGRGKDAYDAINTAYKRYPLLGRQQIGLMAMRQIEAPTPEYFDVTGARITPEKPKPFYSSHDLIQEVYQARPGYITGRAFEERGGWRIANISVEGERPTLLVRPGAATLPATPISGAGFEWREGVIQFAQPGYEIKGGKPGAKPEPIISAGYPQMIDIVHPRLPVVDYQSVEVQTGIFRQVTEQGATYWKKIREVAGYTVPSGVRETVGLMRIKEYAGEKNVVVPLQVTAPENVPLYLSGIELSMPGEYNIETGWGMPGVSMYARSAREQGILRSTDLITSMLRATNPSLAITKTGMWEPKIFVHAFEQVGMGEKGETGVKYITAPVPRQGPGRTLPTVEVGGVKKELWYVTGEGKMDIQMFMYNIFGTLPNQNQLDMISLMNKEAPGIGDAMIREIKKYWRGQPDQPQYDIPVEMLAQTYGHLTGRDIGTTSINYFFGRMKGLVEALPEKESLSRFGYAYQKDPIWWPTTSFSEGEKLMIDTLYNEQYPGEVAANDRKIKWVKQGGLWRLDIFSRGYYGTTASFLNPEFLAKQVRLGAEDIYSINALSPELANVMGVGLSQHPSVTGFEPPHVRAWRALADVSRINQVMNPAFAYTGFAGGPRPFTSIDVSQLPEVVKNIVASADKEFGRVYPTAEPRAGESRAARQMREFKQLTGGAEILTNAQAGAVFPLQDIMAAVSQYQFEPGELAEQETLARIGRGWVFALKDFMEGRTGQNTPFSRWMNELNTLVSSKNINKQLVSKFTEGVSGRYYFISGVPLDVDIVPETAVNKLLRGVAKGLSEADVAAGGTAWTKAQMKSWIKQTYAQAEELGGFPSFWFRSPDTQREYGVMAELAMTPGMLKRKHGIYIPEGTIVQGIYKPRIAAGSPFVTGYAGGVGLAALIAVGDWDADQIAAMLVTEGIFTKEEGLIVRDDLKKIIKQSDAAVINRIRDALTGAFPASMQKNVLLEMFEDIHSGLALQKGLGAEGTYTPEAVDVMEYGILRRKSKQGMGVAFNLRRWLEASAQESLMTRQEINQGIIGMLGSYQGYLDYMIKKVKEHKGFSPLETMFGSVMFTYEPKKGSKGLVELIAKPGADAGFIELWQEQTGVGTSGSVVTAGGGWNVFARNISEAIAFEDWTPKAMATALAELPSDVAVLEERINRMGVRTALFEPGKGFFRENYNPTRSQIGRALVTAGAARTAGEFGKLPKEVQIQLEREKRTMPVFDAIASATFDIGWGYEDKTFFGFTRSMTYRTTMMMYGFATGSYGNLTYPEYSEIFQAAKNRMTMVGDIGNMQALALGSVGYDAEVNKQVILAGMRGDRSVQDIIKGVLVRDVLKENLSIRSSSMPALAFTTQEMVGPGAYSEEMTQKIHMKARDELVLTKFFGLSPDNDRNLINKLLGRTQRDIERMGAGSQWEKEAILEILKEKNVKAENVLTGIHIPTKDRQFAVSLKDYAAASGLPEFTELAAKLLNMGYEYYITGTPDIVGTVFREGKEQFYIGEVKKYSKVLVDENNPGGMTNPYAEVQASSYELMSKAAAQGTIKQFAEAILPLVKGAHQFNTDPHDPLYKVRPTTEEGWQKLAMEYAKRWRPLIRRGDIVVEQITKIPGTEKYIEGTIDPKIMYPALMGAVEVAHSIIENPVELEEVINRIMQSDAFAMLDESELTPLMKELKEKVKRKPGSPVQDAKLGYNVKSRGRDEITDTIVEKLVSGFTGVMAGGAGRKGKISEEQAAWISNFVKELMTQFSDLQIEMNRRVGGGPYNIAGPKQAVVEAVNMVRELQKSGSATGFVTDVTMEMHAARMRETGGTSAELPYSSLAENIGWYIREHKPEALEFYKRHAATIDQLYRMQPKVATAQGKMFQAGATASQQETLNLINQSEEGVGGAMAGGHAFREELVREGLVKGDIWTKSAEGLAAFSKALKEATTQIEILTDQTGKYSKADKVAARSELVKIQAAYAQAETVAREGQYFDTLQGLQAQGIAPTGKQFEELTGGAVPPDQGVKAGLGRFGKGAGRFMRGLIGGWGLMYLGHLASMPMQALSYGMEESQQFFQQMYDYAGGMLGDTGGGAYPSIQRQIMNAKLGYQGTAMLGYQLLQANASPMARDIYGIGIGGVAGAAASFYAAGVAESAQLPGVAAFLGKASIPIGIAAMMGTAAMQAYGNYNAPEAAVVKGMVANARGGAAETWSNFYDFKLGLGLYGTELGGSRWSPIGWAKNSIDAWGTVFGLNVGQKYKSSSFMYGRLPEEIADMGTAFTQKMLGGMNTAQALAESGLPKEAVVPAITGMIAADPRFKNLDATIVARTAVDMVAAGTSFENLYRYAELEQRGIPLGQLASSFMQATQQPASAMEAERWKAWFAEQGLDSYSAQNWGALAQKMASLPAIVTREFANPPSEYRGPVAAPSKITDYAAAAAPLATFSNYPRGQTAEQRAREYAATYGGYAEGASVYQYPASIRNAPVFIPGGWDTSGAMTPPQIRAMAQSSLARFEFDTEMTRLEKLSRAPEWDIYRDMSTIMQREYNLGGPAPDRAWLSDIKEGMGPSDRYAAQVKMAAINRRTTIRERGAAMGLSTSVTESFVNMADVGGIVGFNQVNQAMGTLNNIASMLTPERFDVVSSQVQSVVGQFGAYGLQALQGLATQEPIFMTAAALGGAPPGQQGLYNMLANSDISLTGQLTGLPWGTTSLRRGGSSAWEQGVGIFGTSMFQGMRGGTLSMAQANQMRAGGIPLTGAAQAAIFGFTGPNGQQYGGQWGVQLYQNQIAYDAQMASLGIAAAQANLGYAFQTGVGLERYATVDPRTGERFNLPAGGFWGIQDRQMQLQWNQAQWGFQNQAAQMQMSWRQYQEGMGLQQRGMMMTRQWTQQDWQYQDQMRQLQWGWRQEDFQENVRFMTGRERRLAERQMRRETISFGLEGEQIERTRDRQKESWKLEDERFSMQKRHYEEQKKFQEEALKKQKEFYEQGYELQKQQQDLSRAYYIEQYKLQMASIGAQAAYAQKSKEAADALVVINQQQALYSGQIKVAQADEVTLINTLIGGLNWTSVNVGRVFKSWWQSLQNKGSTTGTTIPNYTYTAPSEGLFDGGGDSRDGQRGSQSGLHSFIVPHGFPNDSYVLRVTSGERVDITPNQFANPWANAILSNRTRASGGGGGPQTIIINIGNKRLGQFVLNNLQEQLEVR